MRVEEVDLPGVGRKFTLQTQAGAELVIVVHHSGRRQMLYYEGGTGDEPVAVLDLTDEEARELGAILGAACSLPQRMRARRPRRWPSRRSNGSPSPRAGSSAKHSAL